MTVQELEQYRPIRGGGWILAAIVLLPPFFYILARQLMLAAALPTTPRLTVEILPVVSGVACLVSGMLTFLRVDGEYRPFLWFVRYWERNVVGYSVLVHQCQGDQLALRLGYRHTEDLLRFGYERCSTCNTRLLFVLRLGGWRSKQGMIVEGFAFYRPNGWEVRLLPSFGGEKLRVVLRVNREQLLLTADAALRLMSSRIEYYPTLGGKVDALVSHEAVASMLVGLIDRTIAKIDGTDRLKCMKEGKRLREWLQDERDKLRKDDPSSAQTVAAATATARS